MPSRPAPPGNAPRGRSETWAGRNWSRKLDDWGRIRTFRDLCDAQVEAQVCGVAAEIAAMTARWLDLLCEFVVRGIWADQGRALRRSG